MKFLCDVHISYKLVKHLEQHGHIAIHVNEILDKWFTKDSDISKYADNNDLIVVTKDADFRDSFFIKKTPRKLIKINLGNITNQELLQIFDGLLNSLKDLDINNPFMVEVDKDYIKYTEKP